MGKIKDIFDKIRQTENLSELDGLIEQAKKYGTLHYRTAVRLAGKRKNENKPVSSNKQPINHTPIKKEKKEQKEEKQPVPEKTPVNNTKVSCKTCGAKVINENTKRHVNSKRHQKALAKIKNILTDQVSSIDTKLLPI